MNDKLRQFIFEELIFVPNASQFKNSDDLLEAGLDSMGIMRLIMYIEEQFGVTLPDNEIEPDNIQSIDAINTWIMKHKQG